MEEQTLPVNEEAGLKRKKTRRPYVESPRPPAPPPPFVHWLGPRVMSDATSAVAVGAAASRPRVEDARDSRSTVDEASNHVVGGAISVVCNTTPSNETCPYTQTRKTYGKQASTCMHVNISGAIIYL